MTDDYLERFVFVPCRFDSAPPHRRFALRATLARCPIGLTARFACALPGPSTALTQRRPIGACFGVASRLLTPAGQKLCFCPSPLRALGGFHCLAQSSMV